MSVGVGIKMFETRVHPLHVLFLTAQSGEIQYSVFDEFTVQTVSKCACGQAPQLEPLGKLTAIRHQRETPFHDLQHRRRRANPER